MPTFNHLRVQLLNADRMYGGEAITMRAHAEQCAQLAEVDGADAPLILAALLHDVGHLIHRLGDDCAVRGINDRHEYTGAALVANLFPEAVAAPIRLHVDAKRWLVANQPGYAAGLSPASITSLELQGGAYNAEESAAFLARPFARDAIRLRLWDDAAKVPDRVVPEVDYFWRLVPDLALSA